MLRSNLRAGWQCFAGLVFLLAGCDQGEEAALATRAAQADHSGSASAVQAAPTPDTAPASSKPAATMPAAAKNGTPEAPTEPATPASLQEAARIIDLRTFPTLEHEEVLYQTATKIGYVIAKPDLNKDVQFYRGKLSDAGWKLDAEKIDSEIQFGTFRCSKQGFMIDVNVVKDPNTGKMQVFLENQGNIDARALPRPAGAEVTQSQPNVTIFRTDAKVDDVAEFVRTELKKLGWREVVGYDGVTASEPGVNHYLMFVQRGMHFGALIDAKEGKSEVMYHASMLKVGLPIMPDAKGRIEHMEAPFLHLAYTTPSKPEEALAFYRKELPALGWSFRAGTDNIEDGKANVALEGPEKEPLRLELLSKGGPTIVLIAPAQDK